MFISLGRPYQRLQDLLSSHWMNCRISTAAGAYGTRRANRSSPIIMVMSSFARPFVNPVLVVRLADHWQTLLTGVSRPTFSLKKLPGSRPSPRTMAQRLV